MNLLLCINTKWSGTVGAFKIGGKTFCAMGKTKWERSGRLFDCVWTVCIILIGLKLPSRLKLNQTSRNKTCILVLANRSKQIEYSQINKVHFSSFYLFVFLNEQHTYLNRQSIYYCKVKLTKVKRGQMHELSGFRAKQYAHIQKDALFFVR